MKKSKLEKDFKKLTLDDKTVINDKDVWKFYKSYIDSVGFISHQIESYNDLIENGIPNIISGTIIVINKHMSIKFGEVYFSRPTLTEKDSSKIELYPTTAMNRGATYQTEITVDITVVRDPNETTHHKKVSLGKIPVMVGSCLCNLYEKPREEYPKYLECVNEIGGTFIVDGGMKVVVPQERTNFNKPYFYTKRKSSPSYEFYSEVRSSAINGSRTTTTIVGIKDNRITVLIPYIDKTPIDIGIIFKALGVLNEEDMVQYIDEENYEFFALSLEKTYHIKTQTDALKIIGRCKKTVVKEELEEDEESDDEPDEESISTIMTLLASLMKECKNDVKAVIEILVSDYHFDDKEVLYVLTKKYDKEKYDGDMMYAKYLLENEVFSHIGKDFSKKAQYFAYIVNRLLRIVRDSNNSKELEDRDHYANKRIDLVGTLMKTLFWIAFKKLRTDCKTACDKLLLKNPTRYIDPIQFIIKNTIAKKLKGCFKTGNWSSNTKSKSNKKNGVSQTFERFNYNGSLCELRKINTPIGDEGNILPPRRLHASSYGMICPYETPEGKSVGLVKQLAFGAYITCGSPDVVSPIIQELKYFIPFEDGNYQKDTVIMVNGDWIGFVANENSKKLYRFLKKLKCTGGISPHTEIVLSNQQLRLWTDAGRLMRPLFIVKKGKIQATKKHLKLLKKGDYSWMDLITNGVVEMIGADEQDQNIRIANFPSEVNDNFQYCEIHPALILGVGASTVPFSNHDQAPRASYQASMSKQAIGIPFSNPEQIMTGSHHMLMYAQKPVPFNKILKYAHCEEMAFGINAIVAIMPYHGENVEDAIVINRAFIQRGGFNSMYYVNYYGESRKDQDLLFEIPTRETCSTFRCYRTEHLYKNGIVRVGEIVNKNDPLICRTQIIECKGISKPKIDASVYFKESEIGYIEAVQRGVSAEGYDYVRIKVRIMTLPEEGDKFASVNGQKGTVGRVKNQEDMPFTQDGIIPDLIVNALMLPSRMTIGQLIECIFGKEVFAQNKNISNPSTMEKNQHNYQKTKTTITPYIGLAEEMDMDLPFAEFSRKNTFVRETMEKLHKKGYTFHGNERMISGITGEMMQGHILIGPMYYQRLKHLSSFKMHARARGPKSIISGQALEGRANGGGLRFGEMERDNLILNGTAAILKDRLFDSSDPYKFWVCELCGQIAIYNNALKNAKCSACIDSECYRVDSPYATKLVFQHLEALGIVPRILI